MLANDLPTFIFCYQKPSIGLDKYNVDTAHCLLMKFQHA